MRARGFSLIELVVALAVSLVAIAAGVALLMASHRSFQAGTDERAVQETARVALDELLSSVRKAGYGMEPTFAFDTGLLANTVMDRIPVGNQARFGGYCGDGDCVRDRVDGPDELVFYARDTVFRRDVESVGVDTLTLTSGAALSRGQVLQIMCYGTNNQWLWAYVTVDSVSTDPKPKVALQASPGQAYDFPYQNALLTEQACFQSGTVRAFKIDRYRYHLVAVDETGAIRDWGTAGTRPYLMLDQGLFDGDRRIQRVIAPDVEDLQFAYEFTLAPADARLLGTTAGVQVVPNVAQDDGGFNLAPENGIPSFDTPSLDPLRTTHHPANIRAVRIAITVRGPRQDPSVPDSVIPAVFNRAEAAGESGYRRSVFESSAYTRNLETRLPVFPTYDATYTAAGFTGSCCAGDKCDGNCGGG